MGSKFVSAHSPLPTKSQQLRVQEHTVEIAIVDYLQ